MEGNLLDLLGWQFSPFVQGVWRVFTPGPATFGGRSLLWGLAVSRAFGDLLMKESNVKQRLFHVSP